MISFLFAPASDSGNDSSTGAWIIHGVFHIWIVFLKDVPYIDSHHHHIIILLLTTISIHFICGISHISHHHPVIAVVRLDPAVTPDESQREVKSKSSGKLSTSRWGKHLPRRNRGGLVTKSITVGSMAFLIEVEVLYVLL